MSLNDLKRYAEACAAADQAIALDKSMAKAYLVKGRCLFYQQKFVDAANSYEKAVSLDQTLLEGWMYLGFSYEQFKEYQKAADAYARVIGQTESGFAHYSAENYLAWVYADKLGTNLEMALKLAQDAVAHTQTIDDKVHYIDTLAWVYFKLGRCVDALSTIHEATALQNASNTIIQHQVIIEARCKQP